MKSHRQAAPLQCPATARSLVLIDFLEDVALGRRNATLEEVIEVQEELDGLLPDADGPQ